MRIPRHGEHAGSGESPVSAHVYSPIKVTEFCPYFSNRIILPSPGIIFRPLRPPSERQVGRLKVMQNYLDRQYRVARYVLELSPIQYDQTRLLITKKLLKGRALKFEALGTLVTAMKAHLLFL